MNKVPKFGPLTEGRVMQMRMFGDCTLYATLDGAITQKASGDLVEEITEFVIEQNNELSNNSVVEALIRELYTLEQEHLTKVKEIEEIQKKHASLTLKLLLEESDK